MEQFDEDNFEQICNLLAERDADLQAILDDYGYPPVWTRPNTFETLVLTILEQQVSLASAYAAYKKLKEKIGTITPQRLLALDDEALRSCYLSRQKIVYTRGLATEIVGRKLSLRRLENLDDGAVRARLKQLKGIGDWTVDIYLIHVLRRLDIFPLGDLALVNAVRMKKGMPLATRDELAILSEKWKPYRTIATMMFWHYYIKIKNIKILH